MEPQTTNETEFERYLLGDMTDEQLADVEVSLVDDGAYARFLVAEQNLIDKYLTGGLSSKDQQLFEDNYLDESPDRLEKVATAKAVFVVLPNLAAIPAPEFALKEQPWFEVIRSSMKRQVAAISYVLAGMIIVSLGTLAYIKSRTSSRLAEQTEQTRRQLEETVRQINDRDKEINELRDKIGRLQRDREDIAQREEELRTKLQNSSTEKSLMAIVLSPFGVKGVDENTTHTIPSNVSIVRLRLKLRPEVSYQSFQVLLNGTRIGNALHPKGPGSVITVKVQSRLLHEGTNRIELLGLSGKNEYQRVDGYSLQIEKK